jgi:hypothetical protein
MYYTQDMQTTPITGNTYPVKDQLRALGGRWNPDAKAWMVPSEKADTARALVAGKSTGPATQATKSWKPTTCVSCGAKASYSIGRGGIRYPDVKIYKNGECSDCYDERKMGY